MTPIVDMTTAHSFNQVFFDNVRLPAEMLVGQEGDGRELQPRRRPLHPADRGRVERVAPRLQENQVVGDPLVSAPRMYVTVRERVMRGGRASVYILGG